MNKILLSEKLSELKALDKAESSGVIEGYASVFGSIDSVDDTIDPKAYDHVLNSGEMPKMFFNHDTRGLPIGVWEEIRTDDKGLFVKGRLNLDLDLAKQVYSALKFGSLNGLSVNLMMDWDDWEVDKKSGIRTIKNVQRLPEISVVGIPCEAKATLTDIKSLTENAESVRDIEDILRDLGCSRKEAMLFISKAKSVFSQQSDSSDTNELKSVSERLERLAANKF